MTGSVSATASGKLFAVTRDNKLWWREPVGEDVNWEQIGYAIDVVGLAAIDGKLFAATSDNRLWWRDAIHDVSDVSEEKTYLPLVWR
jgi:hypothetical protein